MFKNVALTCVTKGSSFHRVSSAHSCLTLGTLPMYINIAFLSLFEKNERKKTLIKTTRRPIACMKV